MGSAPSDTAAEAAGPSGTMANAAPFPVVNPYGPALSLERLCELRVPAQRAINATLDLVR